MNKKISVLLGLVMIVMLMTSCVSASEISKVTYPHDYDSFVEPKIYEPIFSFWGFNIPPMSIAKPSSITTLIKVEYMSETIQDGMYTFDLDTGHVDYIYWIANNDMADVGNDGVSENSAKVGIQSGGVLKFAFITQTECNEMSGIYQAAGSICTIGSQNNVVNFNGYYSISETFTDSYGHVWNEGLFYKDFKISETDASQETESLSDKWAIRRYAMNKYMDENCQDTDMTTCNVPVKFESNIVSISDAVMYYSTFLKDYTCDIGAGNQMVVETFSAGKLVSMYSFRYPVHHFCPSQPVLIVDDKTAKATSNAKFYFDLERGDIIEVPADMTYVFYYVMQNNGEIPLTCRDHYDPETGECTPRVGIVFLCSEGIWSSDIHACIVTAEQVCDQGVYDEDEMKCIWHPPRQAICDDVPVDNIEWITVRTDTQGYANGYCPQGSIFSKGTDVESEADDYCMYDGKKVGVSYTKPASGVLYNIDTQKCEWTPIEITDCENNDAIYEDGVCKYHPQEYIYCDMPGSTYDKDLDKCVYKPEDFAVCDAGGIYNPQTGYCEVEKPTKLICADFPGAVWNPALGMCEYIAETKKTCGDTDGIYDESLDKCLVIADFQYVCDAYGEDAIWDPVRKVCVKNADIEYVCTKGTYDKVSNTCKVNPDIENVCPEGTTYIQATGMCHMYPETNIICPTGFDYDEYYQTCTMVPVIDCQGDAYYNEETGFCVREPQLENFCPNGIYDKSKDKCVWMPAVEIICGDKSTFDAETGVCIEVGDIVLICEKGTATETETGEIKCIVVLDPADPDSWDVWKWITDFFKFLFLIK